MAEPALLDRDEVARRLRVSVRTVRRWGRDGLLEERRVGPRLVRVTESSVEALIRAGKDHRPHEHHHRHDYAAGGRRDRC